MQRAGVRDAENHRVPGHAALRISRLEAALAPAAADPAFPTWVERLRALDESDRRVEIGNLPIAERPPHERLAACSRQLAEVAVADAGSRERLREAARVPDHYSSTARAAGLYALTRRPFFAGVQAWQTGHEREMREALVNPRPALRLVPELVATSGDEHLLAAFAPVLDIDTAGAFDQIGRPSWNDDGKPFIDRADPVLFQRLTHTLVGGQRLVQLVYTLWFPERPSQGAFDLLAGQLDGVVLRITLASDGKPWMLDTIHACGCYHLFFPAPGVTLREGAPQDEEWAFVPASLPPLAPGERFVVRLSSVAHQVIGIGIGTRAGAETSGARYRREPESLLRRLPFPGGGTRSLYGPDGLVAGSERAERWLFWPMGITSAGAMRQWGHHATAFVGRRHFDDADLLDRRFVFPGLSAP